MPEKTESIYTYTREVSGGSEPVPHRIKKKSPFIKDTAGRFFLFIISNVNFYNIIIVLAGVLLGRAVLLGELYPFGAAYAAGMFRVFRNRGVFAAAGAAAGLASVIGINLVLLEMVLSLALIGTGVYLIPPGIARPWLTVPGVVFAGTMVARAGVLSFTSTIPYDYISVLFEAVFAALFAVAVIYALPALAKLVSPGILKGEEMFCILTLAGGIIAGTSGISPGIFALDNVLSYVFILIAALAGGSGLGAAAGALAGLIPGLSLSVSPAVIASFSLCGLLAGLFRLLDKPGVIMGFLLGNIISTVYMGSYDDLGAIVGQSILAAGFFACIPARWIKELKSSLKRGMAGEQEENSEKIVKDILKENTSRWSKVVKNIAFNFEQTCAGRSFEQQGEDGLQEIFDEIGSRVCSGCSHYSVCWGRESYKTYQAFLNLFSIADSCGKLSFNDLDNELTSRCVRTKELVAVIPLLCEIYKMNSFWERRQEESKKLISKQLKSFSDILEGLPEKVEHRSVNYNKEMQLIRQKMKKMGFRVFSLDIYEAGKGFPEVSITVPSCSGRRLCRYEIAPFFSQELGCTLLPPGSNCLHTETQEKCSMRLYPNTRYQVSTASAGAAKDESFPSGDSIKFLPLEGGKFAILLSDGMGSGREAYEESRATVDLVSGMLDAGFSKEMTIKTINSILMLRSPRESFATLDMAIFDVYSAECEFIKLGAAQSYVVRGQQVGVIKAGALPVGIVDEVEALSVKRQLYPGDMIVMITDGISGAYKEKGDEDWLPEVLEEVQALKTGEVAELVANLARAGNSGDDMTVAVFRVEKVKNH